MYATANVGSLSARCRVEIWQLDGNFQMTTAAPAGSDLMLSTLYIEHKSPNHEQDVLYLSYLPGRRPAMPKGIAVIRMYRHYNIDD